jgi:hypothetical protein
MGAWPAKGEIIHNHLPVIPNHLTAARTGDLAACRTGEIILTQVNLHLLDLEEDTIRHPLVCFQLLSGFPFNFRSINILAQRTRLWLSPEGICFVGRSLFY